MGPPQESREMTRTSIIEVGDKIEGPTGIVTTVTAIERGEHGLFLVLRTVYEPSSEIPYFERHAFVPNELPLSSMVEPWYKFDRRGTLKVNEDTKVGYVCLKDLWGDEELPFLEELWCQTVEAIRAEEMQSRPTDITID